MALTFVDTFRNGSPLVKRAPVLNNIISNRSLLRHELNAIDETEAWFCDQVLSLPVVLHCLNLL